LAPGHFPPSLFTRRYIIVKVHTWNTPTQQLRLSIFSLPNVELPSPLTGITRVTSMKMLGVTVTNTLSVAEHVQGIIRGCAASIHVLRVLRSHGLNYAALQTVYRAVIVARLTYATSAWWGFATYDDRQRIEGLLRRGIRAAY